MLEEEGKEERRLKERAIKGKGKEREIGKSVEGKQKKVQLPCSNIYSTQFQLKENFSHVPENHFHTFSFSRQPEQTKQMDPENHNFAITEMVTQ